MRRYPPPQAMKGQDSQYEQFAGALQGALAPLSLASTESQSLRLYGHFEAMVEASRVMNLTRIVEPQRAAVLHYADSLALVSWAEKRDVTIRCLLDIGTGAGFPAVPLAVARPNWEITALDGTRKKVEFLTTTVKRLNIANLQAVHAHGAHWATQARFDLVAFRAIGGWAKLLDQGGRLLATGGWLVAYKTLRMGGEERQEALRVAPKFGLRSMPPFPYQLVLGAEILERQLVIFRKQEVEGCNQASHRHERRLGRASPEDRTL